MSITAKNRHARITEIVLENFQSIRQKAVIPIAPVTFLYGPNSAGKSSVYDALRYADLLFKDFKAFCEKTDEWTHRGPNHKPETSISCSITFQAGDFFIDLSSMDLPGDPGLPDECDWGKIFDYERSSRFSDISVRITASPVNDNKLGGLELFVNDECVLKVNIHPLPFDELSSDWVYKVSTRFPSGYGFFDDDSFKARHNIDSPENEFYSTDFGFPSGDESGLYFYLHPEAYDPSYDKDVLKIANWYIGKLKEFAFSGDLVAPDRGLIPTQSLVMPAILYRRDESQSASVIRCIDALIPQDRRNKTIDLIAHRCLSDHLQMLADAYNQDSDAEETPGEHDAKNSYEPFIDFLNRFLSTHLFVDLAYTLRVKFHQLLPDEGLGLNTTTKRRSRRGVFGVFNTSAIVEIELFDRFGKKTNFEEVGSGVSCALPVIVALWGSGAFIQQPELHLHPALQSSLGDMFLEATTRGSYFLIESHSEYPLLRCLKRLRQSNSGKIKNIDPLFATKDRISVIYFEPNPDGHTNVKRLRLTEEGDFIDRWPRGFFEERGREIFDE